MSVRGLLLGVLLVPSAAWAADPPPAAKAEIQHLLDYLGSSGCQFFRNGGWHSSADARDHVQKKYAALLDRGMVKTTEDFIVRAASESSMSGQPYPVRCAGSGPVTTGKWLQAELARYRNLKSAPK